jgi:hypothetical protein
MCGLTIPCLSNDRPPMARQNSRSSRSI